MSARWIIYRNKKHLGPFSAVEVRALLREGSIDPFDLIAKEGSKVYRELVEVDEVFQEEAKPDLRRTVRTFSEPQGVKSTPSFKEEHTRISLHGLKKQKPHRHDQNDGAFSDASSTTVSMTPANIPDKSSPARSEPVREESLSFNVAVDEGTSTNAESKPANEYSGEHYLKQNLQLAVDLENLEKAYDTPDKKGEAAAKQAERHRRSKKDPKQFYLMAKGGRIWGPLGASEIQNLFFKGVLDRSIQVAKSGSSKSVSIGEFVAKYKQARQGNIVPGNRLMQGAHPFKRRNSISDTGLFRMVSYLRFTQERLTLLYILLGAAILGLACSVWLLYSSDRPGQAAKSSRARSSEVINRQDNTLSRQAREETQKTARAISPSNKSTRQVAAVSTKTVTKPKTAQRQVVRKTTPPRRYIAPRRNSQVYHPPRRTYKPAAIQRRAPAAAVRQVSRTPVTKRAVPPKVSGPNLTTLQNGQRVQRLGPLHYNPSDLNVCTGACRVTFRGGQGFLTAAFFKAAWGDKLAAKGGTAYLTGIIKKNGNHITILVQGVD